MCTFVPNVYDQSTDHDTSGIIFQIHSKHGRRVHGNLSGRELSLKYCNA